MTANKQGSRRMTLCAHIAGLFCLAVNSLNNPSSENFDADRDLTEMALLWVDELVRQTRDERLQGVRDACADVILRTRTMPQRTTQEKLMWQDIVSNNRVSTPINLESNIGQLLDQTALLASCSPGLGETGYFPWTGNSVGIGEEDVMF